MDSFNTLVFEASRYLWPLLTLFQVVVTIIAVRSVKGVGPVLMLAGTLFIMLRSIVNYLPGEMTFGDGVVPNLWMLVGIAFVGRVLFLIGLLLMVQGVYKPQASVMGRTEY